MRLTLYHGTEAIWRFARLEQWRKSQWRTIWRRPAGVEAPAPARADAGAIHAAASPATAERSIVHARV